MKLQCGWEDDCKADNCHNCPRKHTITLTLTEAEICCIDDFSVTDIEDWYKTKREDLDLSQEIMFDLASKIYKEIYEDK